MGLLDSLRYSTGNPDKDAQLNRGLLEMGLALMQSKGPLAAALGQSGMVGLQGADRTRQQQQAQRDAEMRAQMQRLQLGQAQREADIAALPQQFYRAPSMPAVDATGGIETAVEAPNNASGPGGFDMQGYVQALMGKAPMQGMQLKEMLGKPAAPPLVSKPGDVARDPKTGAILWQNPEAPDGEKDAFLRIMKAAGIDPGSEQGKRMLSSYLTKQATHAPPVTLNNFGSPLPIQLPGGGEGYIQPPTRPGGPSQILTIPGTDTPAAKPGGTLNDSQSKANLFGTRAQEADKIIAGLAARGIQSPSTAQQLTGGEGMLGSLATALATPEQQQIDQAQRDFINATLRRESGAVISPAEFTNARKQYFVQPGDSPQVIAQKARNRQIAIGGILAEVPDAKRGVNLAPAASAPDADPLGLRRK